ncbi:MAG: hypothetical protein KME35_02955 [Aphanocapsa sp. GSE-SYN-MK-11-07L]|nr:hypothetical protein [Aphanocapsa sp. GSE-SYN-MK-11-07L]
MQKRCNRNRKRSKRRAVHCPIHGCYLDSVSQKYSLFANDPRQLQQRGMNRLSASLLINAKTAVPLQGEWIEAFWCAQCQRKEWYQVRKIDGLTYRLRSCPQELWQQATGVIQSDGNPSVGEFTKRSARQTRYQGVKAFSGI